MNKHKVVNVKRAKLSSSDTSWTAECVCMTFMGWAGSKKEVIELVEGHIIYEQEKNSKSNSSS